MQSDTLLRERPFQLPVAPRSVASDRPQLLRVRKPRGFAGSPPAAGRVGRASSARLFGAGGASRLPGSLRGCWWGSHPRSRWTKAREPHWLPAAPARGLVTGQLATQRRHSGSKTPEPAGPQPPRTVPARGRGSRRLTERRGSRPRPLQQRGVCTAVSGAAGSVRSWSGRLGWLPVPGSGVLEAALLSHPHPREKTHILAAHSSIAPWAPE